MKILFIDNDHQHARELYTQFLSYRGTSWNVVHAAKLADAQEWLAHDQFDVVLAALPTSGMDWDFYAQFVDRAAAELPVVVLLFDAEDREFVEWVHRGAADCLNGHVANGDYIMRRLRMAISRFDYQKKRLEHHNSGYCRARLIAAQHATTGATVGLAAGGKSQAASDRQMQLVVVTDSDSNFQRGFDRLRVAVAEMDLDHAVELLEGASNLPDAIIVEHALAERHGDQRLYRFLQDSPGVPVIVLTLEASDNTALVVMDRGADECLVTSRTSDADLERAVRMSIARRTRLCERFNETLPAETVVSDRRSQARSRDRRQTARYLITRPILAIPVLPNGGPDTQGICEAFTIDFSATGVGFQLGLETVLPSRNWVVGIEASGSDDWPHEHHFANVMTRNVTFVPGGVRLGTQFRHPEDDLFRAENLMPRLGDGYRMLGSLPTHVLNAWCDLGVLRPLLMHRLKTCPECAAVLVLGSGCLECGSPAIMARELIHHFACALIDDYDKFCTAAEGLKCPKCLTAGLVAGADFEVIKARYRCEECGCEHNELAQVGTCFNCCLRLPINMASDTEVHGYHVSRLDVLAYLSSTA